MSKAEGTGLKSVSPKPGLPMGKSSNFKPNGFNSNASRGFGKNQGFGKPVNKPNTSRGNR